jgi:hypothetical protein
MPSSAVLRAWIRRPSSQVELQPTAYHDSSLMRDNQEL